LYASEVVQPWMTSGQLPLSSVACGLYSSVRLSVHPEIEHVPSSTTKNSR
tara:strand:+ start:156 stop:305 length:150 start_codon:yes stop_codon:yes gene_type:complete